MPATRDSRKNLPPPVEREHFQIPDVFSDADGERMRMGHVPEDMDDKWFIFFEDGWLSVCRSWTGHCIFGVKLDGAPFGIRVTDAWASRDREQYNSSGQEADIQTIRQLIANRLLA